MGGGGPEAKGGQATRAGLWGLACPHGLQGDLGADEALGALQRELQVAPGPEGHAKGLPADAPRERRGFPIPNVIITSTYPLLRFPSVLGVSASLSLGKTPET